MKVPSSNGKMLRVPLDDTRSRRPVPGELDHRRAVVEADRRRPLCERIAEQETAAASDVEELVAGAEGEILEDRHPGEVVDVRGTVDGDRARAGRPAGDAVDQPVVELRVREPGCDPGLPVLVAQPELRKERGDVVRPVGGRSSDRPDLSRR